MIDHHEHNPNPKFHEDPLSGPTWLVGVLGMVLLVIIVLGLIALYHNVQGVADEEKVIDIKLHEIDSLRAEQLRRLEMPHQVRFEDEVATVIPIEHAMQIIVKDYGSQN